MTLGVLDDGYFDFESTWWWLFWLWDYLMLAILTLKLLDDGYIDFESTWCWLLWLWEYLIMVILTLRVLDDGYSRNSLVILTNFDIYVLLPHEYLTILALCFFLLPTHFKYFVIKYIDCEWIWWRLFQKRIVRTKLDRFVFIINRARARARAIWLAQNQSTVTECNYMWLCLAHLCSTI